MENSSPNPTPVAVITGASQGLGRALAKALVARGWSLVIDARRADRLDAAVAALTAHDAAGAIAVVGIAGDITDPEHRKAIARAAATLGPVQLVVNNASTLGASPLPSIEELDARSWRRLFDVNVIAPLALVGALGDNLAANGIIIDITSDAAVEPYEGWGGYGASKAAFEHASRVLAAERPDLRVLIVDPGDMHTEMHQDAFPGEDISDRQPPEASVPGLLALIDGDQVSGGRYQAREIATPERTAS